MAKPKRKPLAPVVAVQADLFEDGAAAAKALGDRRLRLWAACRIADTLRLPLPEVERTCLATANLEWAESAARELARCAGVVEPGELLKRFRYRAMHSLEDRKARYRAKCAALARRNAPRGAPRPS